LRLLLAFGVVFVGLAGCLASLEEHEAARALLRGLDSDSHDADGDGFVSSEFGGGDCDDSLFEVHPGAVEICGDGLDNDCDEGFNDCLLEGSYSEGQAAAGWVGETQILGVFGTAGVLVWAQLGAGGMLQLEQVLKPVDGQGVWSPGERFTVSYDDAVDALSVGLAGGGDLDGDGIAEVVVGVSGEIHDVSVGGAYLVPPGESGSLSLASSVVLQDANGFAGPAVAVTSEGQGDGMEGLLVGSSGGGTTWWLEAPISSTSALTDGLLLVSEGVFELGEAVQVVRAGDLDGDGFSEMVLHQGTTVVLVPGDALHGAVGTYFLWEETVLRFQDTAARQLTVAGVGDLSGDGRAQLAIGLPESDSGRIGLYIGADTSLDWRWTSEEPSYGEGLAAAGDVNGDGRADVLVGCSAVDRVDLFLGGPNGEVGPAAAAAQFHGGGVGKFVWGPGDLNDDGLDEVFLGAPERLEDAVVQGGVLLFAAPGL
jgi:hypothetical protein